MRRTASTPVTSTPVKWDAGSGTSRPAPELSARVKEICRSRGLSLRRLAAMTGVPVATLSKVQNKLATLSYVQLTKLAAGLNIELSELFTSTAIDVRAGRRAITRKGHAPRGATQWYEFEMLCGELSNKKMNPGIMEVAARSLKEAGGLIAHEGEEFIFVLSGQIDVHSEDYKPVRLDAGDCIYIDSTSAHAYVNTGSGPLSRLLAITSHVFIDPRAPIEAKPDGKPLKAT